MRKSLCFAAALLSLAACTREIAVDVPEGEMVLVARTERPTATRTVLEGGTFVYWEPGDEIAVFAGGKSGKFVGDLTESEATANFKGSLGEDNWAEGMDLWAVYPYSDKAVLDGEAIVTLLPSEQTARTGSFGKDMNLSVARSSTSTLQFYNVGGGVRFTLSQDGISEVVFEGLNGEILAGKVKVGFQDGVPAILGVTEGKSSITLTPPDGETFKKDAWYYIVAIPGALENGFTFRFRKAGETSSCTYSKPVTIKRGSYGVLTYADKGMDETVTDDVIDFQDPLVESIVVKYFDTGGDGKLSFHEAAVVLSFLVEEGKTRATDGLVSIFAGTGITTFDELQYFTGLTRIDDGAFEGCTELTSITIPENIESIGDDAFKGCTNLKTITATSLTPPAIGTDAFADTGNCPILVPEGAVETYVAAWNEYKDRIRPDEYPEPEIVDLGLSVKWASFNLGASSPEKVGHYFAWGETEPYYSSLDPLTWKEGKEAGYDWPSYKWCMGTKKSFTKYCDSSSYGYEGFKDDKHVLDPEDDAAAVNLGGKWRMPTAAEIGEMLRKCDREQTSLDGVAGWRITGPNGNSIFLPSTGSSWEMMELTDPKDHGYYWSSSLYFYYYGYGFIMFPSSDSWNFYGGFRSTGMPIRPVYGDPGIPIKSISVDKTTLELQVGESAALTVRILPENASIKDITWQSGDETVATVSPTGVVTAVGPGTVWIGAVSCDPNFQASCTVTVPYPAPEAVDMGLAVKWGSFNLGATSPEQAGEFFAWGETEPKTTYTWSNYAWTEGNGATVTKYTGVTGDKIILDPEDDAASVKLGGKWRMPTDEDWTELCSKTKFDWVWDDSRKGYTVTSKIAGHEGNSIFLPAAGYRRGSDLIAAGDCGLYWTLSLYASYPYEALGVYFDPSYILGYYYDTRYSGFSIRPVYGDRPVTTDGDIEGTGEEPWN